jgi:hypothetical protein
VLKHPPLGRRLHTYPFIHPTSWKRSSRKFICRILHKLELRRPSPDPLRQCSAKGRPQHLVALHKDSSRRIEDAPKAGSASPRNPPTKPPRTRAKGALSDSCVPRQAEPRLGRQRGPREAAPKPSEGLSIGYKRRAGPGPPLAWRCLQAILMALLRGFSRFRAQSRTSCTSPRSHH